MKKNLNKSMCKKTVSVKVFLIFIVLVCFSCGHGRGKENKKNIIYVEDFQISFTVEKNSGGKNGRLTAEVNGEEIYSPVSLSKGDKITFKAIPNTNYEVEKWTGAEQDKNDPQRAYLTVTEDTKVKVHFTNSLLKDFAFLIIPPEDIEGKEPSYTLAGEGEKWKGVFVKDRVIRIQPFAISKYELNYKLWKDIYDWAISNGYKFANKGKKIDSGESDDCLPVTMVSWRDCIIWCNAYTQKSYGEDDCVYRNSKDNNEILKDATDALLCDAAYADLSRTGFRLPTEAEWEFASRYQGSGSDEKHKINAEQYGKFFWFTKLNSASGAKDKWDSSETNRVAWHDGNAESKIHAVGLKDKNAIGLYDMSGNVLEWCFDIYNENPVLNDALYENDGFVTDPLGAYSGTLRLYRGGSWYHYPDFSCVGLRSNASPFYKTEYLGLRLVCSIR